MSGTTLYVGGDFTTVDGQSRNHLAAFDTATGALTSWNPNVNSRVTALALRGTTLYAGGYFTTVGAAARSLIAAIDTGTGLATSWDPSITGATGIPHVSALAVHNTTLYVGGLFDEVGGIPQQNLVEIDVNNVGPTVWDPSPNGEVAALAISDNTLYVGGAFTMTDGLARERLASYKTGLTTITSLASGAEQRCADAGRRAVGAGRRGELCHRQ